MQEKESKHHFDIHASVVLQLGETLITDVAQALVELVKNSYDADASYAKVIVDTESSPGKQSFYPNANGYISIEDDGIGMDEATIIRGWLTVSNSPKREMKRLGQTTERGRTPLGDKGLGRLCAQRLAFNLEIFTRPVGSPVEYHVAFSWKSFLERDITLTEVPVFFEEIPPQRSQGTKLLITSLKDVESWKDSASSLKPVDDLQIKLSQLISPYMETRDFIVSAIFNGRRLELAEYSSQFKKAAIINYKFVFNEKQLHIKGKAKLDLFRPGRYSPSEEKLEYRNFLQEDGGKKFLDFLLQSSQSQRYKLKKSDEETWYVEYEYLRNFVEIDKVKLLYGKAANPGPFYGEIDSFYLDDRSEIASNLGGDTVLKSFIKDFGGLRVYRDGFGIRIDSDLLELRNLQTSGRSFYGLRPGNITGYIALSAKDNAVLEEKTDREGFQANPYYENFILLIREVSRFTIDAQTYIRREYNRFKEKEKSGAQNNKKVETEEIYKEITANLASTVSYGESLRKSKDALEEVANDTATILKFTETITPNKGIDTQPIKMVTQSMTQKVESAKKEFNQVEISLQNLPELQKNVESLNNQVVLLKSQIALLGEQLSQTYETVGLGLTAESLSHEITNIIDQLAYRNRQIMDYLASRGNKEIQLVGFTRYINTAVSSLRKQLSHLQPSLRYVRENREHVALYEYFLELEDFYKVRFASFNIEMQIKNPKQEAFAIFINKGKLNQIIDNLFLNSEYWLREDLRLKRMARGVISVELSKPFVRISDNGRGIDISIEKSLFEPFVTTKGQGRGRGLGLFIVQQLLASENCGISLAASRNKYDRLHVFEIDFTGGLSGNNKH
ncbi:hypothetical protein KSC_086620 [Ktedonobacter sp. SOSP1-52]|uniref:ATP-binding protein n=1 Tax=Ktedonobacter sp. SOSP1-52 TaxID=2778366 RepID=UPI0019169478|nr:ATP-binding protein [Ktedonobacter sp. SOSP1-52]GHO69770.1 hypothetical protein KSC_086620 [Ktedonobacter sp. SOSP1-52]